MAGSLNKVMLIGNLGADPEVRTTEGGIKVATFRVATSESYNDRNTGQRVEQTEWHTVVVWRKLAEIAEQYLNKGKKVYVEGKLRTRQWQDQSGNNRYTTEVVADNFTMLSNAREDMPAPGAPQGGARNFEPTQPSQASTDNKSEEDDDLPF